MTKIWKSCKRVWGTSGISCGAKSSCLCCFGGLSSKDRWSSPFSFCLFAFWGDTLPFLSPLVGSSSCSVLWVSWSFVSMSFTVFLFVCLFVHINQERSVERQTNLSDFWCHLFGGENFKKEVWQPFVVELPVHPPTLCHKFLQAEFSCWGPFCSNRDCRQFNQVFSLLFCFLCLFFFFPKKKKQ